MKTNKTRRPSSVAALRRVDAHPLAAPVRSSVPPVAGRPRTKSGRNRPAAGGTEPQTPRDIFVLRLFVAGATTKSHQAILRVRELCEAELKGICKLEVIDIYQQPKLARANQIVATPTLIMEFPPPVRRFIGSLANITGLFVELDLITKGKIAL